MVRAGPRPRRTTCGVRRRPTSRRGFRRAARRILVLLLVAPAVLGGCATRGDLQELRFDIRNLAARQDSAFAALERAMRRDSGASTDSLAAIVESLFVLRGEVNNRLQSIQEQQRIMGELVGQSQHAIALMTEQLAEQQRQFDAMLARSEMVVRGDALADTALEAPPDPVASEDEGEADDVAADPADEAFAAIVELLDRGLTSSARRGLETFLEEYPNSAHTPAAYLHLAEMRALEDEVERALETYLAIPDLFPEADEVPRALFQAGLLAISVDDLDRAREYLQWLVDEFPDHRLAPQARDQLEQIP